MLRQSLLTAAQFAAQAVTAKGTLAILETLLIEAKDGKGRITGSNLDLFASHDFECDVDLHCCVASKRLLSALNGVTEDEISIEPGKGKIVINAGTSRVTRETLPPDEFPQWAPVEGKPFIIPSAEIKRVISAASTEEGRYTLNSAYLDKEGWVLSADGRRIHAVKMDEAFPCSIIIPTRVAQLLSNVEGVMRCDGQKFTAEGDGWTLTGKLIEGVFPNWKVMMFPAGVKHNVADEFESKVHRAVACSEDNICERVDFSSGEISSRGHIDALDMDFGFKFGIKPSYLLAAIKDAKEGATIAGTENQKGIRIDNGPFTAVIAAMFEVSK